jgi:hypothetical protein
MHSPHRSAPDRRFSAIDIGTAQAFLIKTGLQFLRRRINLTLSHTTDVNHRAPVFGSRWS